MNTEKTLTHLRSILKGRIYICLKDESTCKQFLEQAETEGFRFGNNKPTESPMDNIIALEHNKQLSFVGFAGHMAVQCNGGSNYSLIIVDYDKYIAGAEIYVRL